MSATEAQEFVENCGSALMSIDANGCAQYFEPILSDVGDPPSSNEVEVYYGVSAVACPQPWNPSVAPPTDSCPEGTQMLSLAMITSDGCNFTTVGAVEIDCEWSIRYEMEPLEAPLETGFLDPNLEVAVTTVWTGCLPTG